MANEQAHAPSGSVTIVIVEEHPMGYADNNRSITVPVSGPIETQRDCPVGWPPGLTTFEEYFGYSHCGRRAGSRRPRAFPAIRAGQFYMLWVDERQEWIGIEFEYKGHGNYEQNIYGGGHDETIYASGPYQLSELSGAVILKVFGNPPISASDVLRTSPSELREFEGLKKNE